MKRKVLNILRLVIINYVVFVTLLVTLEIAGQLSYRLLRGKFLFSDHSTAFEKHPYLVGTPKKNLLFESPDHKAKITTNAQGFRITRENTVVNKRINVLCLGGSTTFGTGVTDEDTWPYILQQKLGEKYNVLNLGVPGYSTLEALVQLITIVPELKPDIVIVYQGWNDMRSYHSKPKTPDYYWHGVKQETNLEVAEHGLWNSLFVTKLAAKIKFYLRTDGIIEEQSFAEPDLYIDSIYVRNLNSIKLLCDHLKVKSVFIPQVINVDAFQHSKQKTNEWTPYILNKEVPVLMRRFNSLMGTAIQQDKNTVVIDNILDGHTWLPRHFKDYVHLSREGGDFFTDIVMKSFPVLD
jgi:hypothetical protein